MSKIYVVIKMAKESAGEFAAAATEAAFKNESHAREWLQGKPIVWDEQVNGVMCYCERAIHETEIQD